MGLRVWVDCWFHLACSGVDIRTCFSCRVDTYGIRAWRKVFTSMQSASSSSCGTSVHSSCSILGGCEE